MATDQGYATALAIDAAGTAVGSFTSRFEFNSISGGEEIALIDSEGIRGTRSRAKERVKQGLKKVATTIVMNPSPTELDALLPWILGAAESVDTFALAETLPARAVLIDYVSKRHTQDNAYVNRAIFRCQTGQALELTIEFMAKTNTEAATAFPSISIDTDDVYVMSELSTVTIEGSSRAPSTLELTIDNQLAETYNNSQTPTDIDPQDRIVTVSTEVTYNGNDDLFTNPKGSSAGAAATYTFTNGGKSLTFTIANGKILGRSPVIQGKSELRLPIEMQCYKSGSTSELVVTNDPVA